MPYCYANIMHYDYTNVISDSGGENEIIMFKSCYPNSEVRPSIADEQVIYNELLDYFSQHIDKMFILVIPLPEIVIDSVTLTRQLANWLVNRQSGWLAGYQHNNVYAFDYYNVLTHPDNHHWVVNNHEQHVIANSSNELYYPGAPGNDHPSTEGHQKATAEFLPLLNG